MDMDGESLEFIEKRRSESGALVDDENLQNKEKMEEERDGGKRTRIHVGGLGGSVTEDDLRRMFGGGGGGTVEGVEIVRTKGRSFAYVDLVPSSDKSLSKLFTTYNGCAWKGGKLSLHKAKEHYLVRLQREWAEDAAQRQLQLPLPADDIIIKPTKPLLPSQKNTTKQLRIFFPALRTVKALPFSGTGKHKYSFQRVQLPSLPLHFCDCEEHSVPSHHPANQHQHQHQHQNQNQLCDGINEQELSIMNKVMDKLFQTQQNVSDTDQTTTAQLPHQLQVATPPEPDDDNLIINVVSTNHQADDKLSEFQELRSSGTQALKQEGPSQNVFKPQKNINAPPNKKRKSLPGDSNNPNKLEAAIPGSKMNFPTHSKELPRTQPDLGVQQVSWSQKSSWRQLVGHRGSSTFSVSHVLTGNEASSDQVQPKSGSLEEPHSDSKNQDLESNGDLDGQLCEMELVDQCVQLQPAKSSRVSNKPGKGCVEPQPTESSTISNKPGKGCVEPQPTESSAVSNKSGDGCVEPQPAESSAVSNKSGDGCVEPQPAESSAVSNNSGDGCVEPQPTESSAVSNKSGRGAFWRQQSSWTQLVNDNTNSSFSIKQIVPGISFEQQSVPKPKGADVVSPTENKLKEIVKPGHDKFTTGGSSSLRIGKEGDVLLSPEGTVADNDGACAPGVEKICDLTPKQASAGNVEVGETCSFMRSAASLKEWAKIKAALSGSLKRKNVEN